MMLSVEKWLATVAFLAAIGLPACSVEVASSGLGSTGSGGSAGAGGKAATSSTTSTSTASTTSAGVGGGSGGSGTGGAAGGGGEPTDGGASDVSVDAGGSACFADDADGGDAASPRCSVLAYNDLFCDDAGQDRPLGAFICRDLEGDLKTAAFQELLDCLKKVPGADGGASACSTEHDAAAADCSKNIFNRSTCAAPSVSVDGGAYGCAQVVASCPGDGGAGGITLAQCQSWLAPFNAEARQFIFECNVDPTTPAGSSCADKFENECVFPPL